MITLAGSAPSASGVEDRLVPIERQRAPIPPGDMDAGLSYHELLALPSSEPLEPPAMPMEVPRLEEAHPWPGSVREGLKRIFGSRPQKPGPPIPPEPMPRELEKVPLPSHVIEPPDVLLIEVHKTILRPDAPLEPLEGLFLQALGTIPFQPEEDELSKQYKRIDGVYLIQSDGTVNLGPEYGSVPVVGLTVAQARQRIEEHLRQFVKTPRVAAARQTLTQLPISGTAPVQHDGTISLGIHGSVYVAGLTIEEAEAAIAQHLASSILDPQVNIELITPLSKVYYVVLDGGGYGEQVARLPLVGGETVLDAISQVGGLPPNASKRRIWVVRPGAECGDERVLPVDWNAIVYHGRTETNYQIFPGDRIYIASDCWIASDNLIAKVTAPFVRVLGFVNLGHSTVRTLAKGDTGGTGAGGLGGSNVLGGFYSGFGSVGGGLSPYGLGGYPAAGLGLGRPGVYGPQGFAGPGLGAYPYAGAYQPPYAPFGGYSPPAPKMPE